MVRRTGLPRRHEQILAAEQQPRALWTADRLPSAVRDNRSAPLQVDARNRENFGGCIHEDGNVFGLGNPGNGV